MISTGLNGTAKLGAAHWMMNIFTPLSAYKTL